MLLYGLVIAALVWKVFLSAPLRAEGFETAAPEADAAVNPKAAVVPTAAPATAAVNPKAAPATAAVDPTAAPEAGVAVKPKAAPATAAVKPTAAPEPSATLVDGVGTRVAEPTAADAPLAAYNEAPTAVGDGPMQFSFDAAREPMAYDDGENAPRPCAQALPLR